MEGTDKSTELWRPPSFEVALSLLGIPRSEVALGIFADVNTYDVN